MNREKMLEKSLRKKILKKRKKCLKKCWKKNELRTLRNEIRAIYMSFLQWKACFQWTPLLTMEMSHRYGIIDTNEYENATPSIKPRRLLKAYL